MSLWAVGEREQVTRRISSRTLPRRKRVRARERWGGGGWRHRRRPTTKRFETNNNLLRNSGGEARGQRGREDPFFFSFRSPSHTHPLTLFILFICLSFLPFLRCPLAARRAMIPPTLGICFTDTFFGRCVIPQDILVKLRCCNNIIQTMTQIARACFCGVSRLASHRAHRGGSRQASERGSLRRGQPGQG